MPSKLLLLLTGGTGVESINNQLQADKYAAEGFLVIVPDQYVLASNPEYRLRLLISARFDGDAAPNTVPEPSSPSQASFIERLKLGITETAKSFMIDMWLARQTPEKVMPRLLKVIESARDEFADAIANGGGIYAVGYCVGAKYVLLLAGEQNDAEPSRTDTTLEQGVAKQGPYIKAAAVAHAAQVTPDDLAGVRVPTFLICVQNDPLFPEELLHLGIEALEKTGVDHEVKIYPEVPHGVWPFDHRPAPSDLL